MLATIPLDVPQTHQTHDCTHCCEQQDRPPELSGLRQAGFAGLIRCIRFIRNAGFVRFIGCARFIGLIRLIRFVGLVRLVRVAGFYRLIRFVWFIGFYGLNPSQAISAPTAARAILNFFPRLKNTKLVRTWAGSMDECADKVPVMDRPAEVPGLSIACGFTGHGFGIAPAAGLLLSELVLDGRASTLSLEAFRYDRFARPAD